MPQFHYQVGNEVKTVRVERTGVTFAVTIGDQRYTVEAQAGTAGRLHMTINGKRTAAVVATGERPDPACYVWLAGESWAIPRVTEQRRPQRISQSVATDRITAPMPGQILDLLVAPGAAVAQGDPLVVLSAMKMETRIVAPHAGVVAAVGCTVGETVQRGQLLVQLTPANTIGQSLSLQPD
ncbi:MAG: acetyl-CoA carboxylase biotin carboxyl carrier protein subunit [Caldilinea sp. CFX5]|nr:acetyl-CoA carboxylase biotin carboxyl carrier protein subunit [Caldilinea sp. CFX5]